MRLMSHCATPRSAPASAVKAPIVPASVCASCEALQSGAQRATRYTPAVTIVAAWISAETGVGPSIASGSHVCSGSCADFAAAPMNKNTHVQNSHGSSACGLAKTSPNETDPMREKMMKIANMMPTSPTTLMTNALRAAATADGLKNQNPIRKYDASPTKPQPTSSPAKLSESTSVSIANTKKFM